MSSDDYDRLLQAAEADDRVLGLVLTGSRGRGVFVHPESDWDVRLVVRDDHLAECEARFETPHGSAVEVAVYSLAGFEGVGELGSPSEWDRYSYAHAEVAVDKLGGRIAELVAEKGTLPPQVAAEIAERELGAYINSYYRSAKNLRNDLFVEAQLDAAESISPFLTALFAMYGRVRPFNKFLRWELETFPLGDPIWSAADFLPRLQEITAGGAIDAQQSLFRDAERLARERGLAAAVDAWEPDVAWLRGTLMR
jgi:hypothetical protein